MSRAPEVTVVTATRDRAERLEALLRGLEAQTFGADRFEVVVIDDGSRDATPAVLARASERGVLALRGAVQPASRGPAAARNRGWRAARAPLIAFTDDDCVPTAAWLEALVATAARNPQAIVQGRTVPDPGELGALGPFARTFEVAEASPHYETCNILYPRAVLEALDGFDEAYGGAAGEDTDLGWRARAQGIVAVFAPEALVHHAVHEGSPLASLRDALRDTDRVRPYRDHPGLRAYLTSRVFLRRSHALLLQAVLAAWMARRNPTVAVFALPYVAHVAARSRGAGARPATAAPFFALRDAVEVGATLRGAVRHRFPVI